MPERSSKRMIVYQKMLRIPGLEVDCTVSITGSKLTINVESHMTYQNILVAACEQGNDVIVEALLKNPLVNPAAQDNRAIIAACTSGNEKVAKHLLADTRVNPAARHETALLEACSRGYKKIVKLLLARSDIDPGTWKNCPLRIAANAGHTKVVALLLADPRIKIESADIDILALACENGYVETATLLMQYMDPSKHENVVLRSAVERGDDEIVEMLLADSRVDALKHSDQLLCVSAGRGYTKIVDLLIKAGCSGEVALKYAQTDTMRSFIKSIIQKMPDIINLTAGSKLTIDGMELVLSKDCKLTIKN